MIASVSLRIKLLLVLAVLLSASLAAELTIAWRWQHALNQQLSVDAGRVLQRRALFLSTSIDQAGKSLRLMAAMGVPRNGDTNAVRAFLSAATQDETQFEGFFYGTAQGKVYPAYGPDFSLQDQPEFLCPHQDQQYFSPPVLSRQSGQVVLIISEPVRDDSGRIHARLAGTLRLQQLTESLFINLPGRQASAMLLDQQGRVLAGSIGNETLPAFVQPDHAKAPVTAAILASLLHTQQSSSVADQTVKVGTNRYRVFATNISTPGLRLVYVQPENELLRPVHDALQLIWTVEGALFLLAALTFYLFYRFLLRPVQSLVAAHTALQQGDHSVRVPVLSGDELGELATSFNHLAANLGASHQRFQAVFEAFPYPVLLKRVADGRYLEINPAFLHLVGQERSAVLGHTLQDLEMGVDLVEVQQHHQQLISTGKLDGIVCEVKAKDGSHCWLSYSSRILQLDGQPTVLTVGTDITYLKELEASLRKNEAAAQRFRFMVNNAKDSILVLHNRRIVECNPAALELFGCTQDEIIGHHTQDFMPLHQPDGTLSDVAGIRWGQAALAGVPQRFEWVHCTRDGVPFYGEVVLSRFVEDGQTFLIDIIRDSSARKQAETELHELNATLEARIATRTQELQDRNAELARTLDSLEQTRSQLAASEQLLSSVIAASGDGFWDWDLRNQRMYLSPRMREILGRAQDEEYVAAENILDMVLPEDQQDVRTTLNNCIEKRLPYQKEHRFKKLDGTVIWIRTCGDIAECDVHGHSLRLVGNCSDISSRKQAELELKDAKARTDAANVELADALDNLRRIQAELVRAEKLASLGALVAGISHELNTPIGNAVTVSSTLLNEQRKFASLLDTGLTRSALANFVNMVQEASQSLDRNLRRAVDLVGSFKQLAVDQSSDLRRSFELSEVVQDVLLAMEPAIRKSHCTVHQQVETPLLLDSYPGSLGQVLINLINNAMIHAFAERQPGNIWIHAQRRDSSSVRITVRDDGRGIPAEIQARIFDPFFTTRLSQGGSGLGLHIVLNMVINLLGGAVNVESKPEAGTIFEIWIPLCAPIAASRSEDEVNRA